MDSNNSTTKANEIDSLRSLLEETKKDPVSNQKIGNFNRKHVSKATCFLLTIGK